MKIPAEIAALRPGASEEAVRQAYGERWRRPGPHDEGWLWGFKTGVPADLRFGCDGRVGQVRFSPWSPKRPVEGLCAGMTLAQAQAVLPQLAPLPPEPESLAHGFSHHRALLPDGCHLTASVKAGVLQGTVAIENPRATYPDEAFVQRQVDALYARFLPLQADSAPMRDRNLKLAVLDSLLIDGRLELGAPAELAQFVLRRRCDLEREGYQRLEAAHDLLARLPLSDAELAAVTWLGFDGGGEIARYAHYFWDGESDDFDVHDLAGIECLPQLQSLSMDGRCLVRDLRQIAGLTGLRELTLGSEPHDNEAVLLSLPALRSVGLFSGGLSEATCEALRARGVEVHLFD